MHKIRLMATRHSVFYAPLHCAIAGGFWNDQGLDVEYTVGSPEEATKRLLEGSIDVAQSAVSASWPDLEKGRDVPIRHFAQINRCDGFFLVARAPDPDFAWRDLRGKKVLVDHGRQPLTMFRFAAEKSGIRLEDLQAIDAGSPEAIEAAFRSGIADYAHMQGPAPQQLEHEGLGHIVLALGDVIGPIAFSSLRATDAWLLEPYAPVFLDGFTKGRRWAAESPSEEVARALQPMFPTVASPVLRQTVAAYQRMGTWKGDSAIERSLYDAALNVFLMAGAITRRHAFDVVVKSVQPSS